MKIELKIPLYLTKPRERSQDKLRVCGFDVFRLYHPRCPQDQTRTPELMLIRADSAWAITQGLSLNSDLGRPYPGPVIAIIDSGVDYTHEDLASPGKVIKGMNFIANTSDPMDDYGHGTGVAGVAAAEGNNGIGIPGMSWASPIVAEKVVAANSYVNLDLLPAAINDALGHGAKIINISLGGSGTAGLDVIASALDIANKAGALVVAGAGNDHCSSPFYPAGFAQSYTLNGKTYDTTVLSVGGIDQDGNIATNTSTTCQHDTGSNFGPWVDLYAPWYAYTTESHLCNLDACSPGARYSLREGTSYATPYVSGAAALVWAANPQANALGRTDARRTAPEHRRFHLEYCEQVARSLSPSSVEEGDVAAYRIAPI